MSAIKLAKNASLANKQKMTLLSQALTDVDAAREKPDLFIATFLLSSNEILQNFSCNFKFFAHATLLKAVSGLQYIITVARSADA